MQWQFFVDRLVANSAATSPTVSPVTGRTAISAAPLGGFIAT